MQVADAREIREGRGSIRVKIGAASRQVHIGERAGVVQGSHRRYDGFRRQLVDDVTGLVAIVQAAPGYSTRKKLPWAFRENPKNGTSVER
jgi:hypothetical protein